MPLGLPTPLRNALASAATLVTPNNRLARRLVALYDDAQHASGLHVWPAPDILPWAGWLERLWLDVLASGNVAGAPTLLAPAQTDHLWSRIVGGESLPLIDAEGVAALAGEAWSLAHAWGADEPSWRAWAGGDDDCATFARWAEAYARRLSSLDGVDVAQLPDWIAHHATAISGWRGSTVVLAGFVETTPQQERLLAALDAAGMRVQRVSTLRETPGELRRAAGTTPRDELARALTWARDHAIADPRATIGVAVVDLGARRSEAISLAEEILCPDLQWPGQEEALRPYSLSLGAPVADVALVASALDLIALAHAPLAAGRVAALLRSPYLHGGRDAFLRRAPLEADWLEQGRERLSVDEMLAALAQLDRPHGERWQAARRSANMPAYASPREWTERWRDWLAAMGWPGERTPSSSEWQARDACDRLLAQFAGLGAVASRMPRSEAASALAAMARRQVYQPESPRAQVQILGALEATGLPLDALWVTGLAAEEWPPAPAPNPLLALSWQRERNVPRSSASRELAYARALTDQWARGAPRVVFSHAQNADEHFRSASLLLPPAAAIEAEEDIAPPSNARAQFDAAPALETLRDDYAPAVPIGSSMRGGAGLIAAQSDCPFRAMSVFRLGADVWPEPVEGLSPIERGNLVHAALAGFWRDVGSHAVLLELADADLDARIEKATTAALAILPAARWRRLPLVLRGGEAARIAYIVRTWLDEQERPRPPFAVAELEGARPVALSGLLLRLRLDRLDALGDGSFAIIDYKTGMVVPPARWFDPRPQAPQIGLYVLAQRAAAPGVKVRAAAYGQVKAGAIKSLGIAADATAWPALATAGAVPGAAAEGLDSWAAIEAWWGDKLGALATEVRDGYAAVSPRDPNKTCANCGLQAFCRVGALERREGAR